MTLILRLGISFAALAACFACLMRFKTIEQFSNLKLAKDSIDAVNIKNINATEYEPKLQKTLEDSYSSFDERSKVAVSYAEIAEAVREPNDRILYLCKTLAALSSTLQKEPMRARTLVAWANVKQILGSYKCSTDNSKGFEEAIELALQADPLDQQVLFKSALVYLWAGNREKAYPIFKRVLELSTDSSVFQRNFIYSLVNSSDSLNTLIPAKLPQAIEFMHYVEGQNNISQFASLPKKSLSEFLTSALLEFSSRYENKTIDAALYLDRLYDLWKITKESAVTPVIDRLLTEYYRMRGPEEIASFFLGRSRLTELEVVGGYKSADSRPEKSAIAHWGYAGPIYFDEFFSSVGFFLPRDRTLRRIELHSTSRSEQQISGLLRILESDDNNSWEDVTGLCTISQVSLPGRWIVYADLPGSTKRFWKIHYASPARNNQFTASLPSMLRVFGIGSLKD